MGILVLTSWLIIIPVRFVYLICLHGVTLEDYCWDKVWKHNTAVKLSHIVLLIPSIFWLWSNLSTGLICLVICFIAFCIVENNRSIDYDDNDQKTIYKFKIKLSGKQARFWNVFQIVRCLFRYVVGIMWLWSHQQLLLYLSPFVAVFICFIVFVVTLFNVLGSRRLQHTDSIEDNSVENLLISAHWWIKEQEPFTTLGKLMVIFYIYYYYINWASKAFWGSVWGRRKLLGWTNDITIHSSITSSSRDSSTSTSTSTSTSLGTWQAMTGKNVNGNGTQTIGGVSIREHNFHLTINGDIVFKTTFITRDQLEDDD
ncbi:hypothetical protein RND81_14G244100 [Saponaria officinalis]|uniref:Uncharacterized protein n=1 Tax=Saponaria officinalis TaxID=3572 RepID=A0AAW1GT87_SAPOF